MKQIRYSINRSILASTLDTPEVVYGSPEGVSLDQIRMLPPCVPTKIVCVGRNYLGHARELGNQPLQEPLIFLKPRSSLIASGDAIVYPPGLTQHVDYEGELGVVIGKRARNVKPQDALDHILGYTCVNDVTARDLQRKDPQWTRGKGFDTFCPMGPALVPKADVDYSKLRVQTLVNGKLRQDSPVLDMIFPVERIIEYVTEFMTLEPGDVIATGTPEGVGPLKPGDVVRVQIDGIGVLENVVVQG